MNPILNLNLNRDAILELDRWRRIEIAKRAAKRKDILTWGAMLFPEKFGLPFCHELHDYFISIRLNDRTSTKAPRYHAKTTIACFLIPIFQAVEEPTLYGHYLQVQANGTKANAANLSIRYEFEENREFVYLYGDQVTDQWAIQQFVLKNGVCFSAVGAGQSIRGIQYRNQRPDNIMADDLYDEEDIHNPDGIEKKNAWFWSTLYPARAQGVRNSIHVTGTAISQYDLMNRLENLSSWKARTFKAIPDWDNKVVIWPEKNTFESLMIDMESMTSAIFMREMQNEPRDDSESFVKLNWIQEYDPGTLVPSGRFEYIRCILGCDPSIGKKEENDKTGIALFYVFRYTDSKGYFYYLDKLWNARLSLDARVNLLQTIQNEQPANRKIEIAYIEAISGFMDFADEAKRRTDLPIRVVDKKPDKMAELETKAWFFERGRVFVNKHIKDDLKKEWIHQMTTNHPKHDDMRDATLVPLQLEKRDAFDYWD